MQAGWGGSCRGAWSPSSSSARCCGSRACGRRDAPYDAGLPTVLRAYRGGEPLPLGAATVTELNDQHAFVTAEGLRPGDLLCLGISHPCGAFDRWRTLLEVDADYTVTRAIRTFF